MNDITKEFEDLFNPIKAFVVYQHTNEEDLYVESFDISKERYMINAHPLTEEESKVLAQRFYNKQEKDQKFLFSKGMLPSTVLKLHYGDDGYVVWYTKAKEVYLNFTDKLKIPNGKACVPPLLWKASKRQLHIYALQSDDRPESKTRLYHAPFFNTYDNGWVCMGNVEIEIDGTFSLEDFIEHWEKYFFNSYFDHMSMDESPINGNIIEVWNELIDKGKPFPLDLLKPSTIKIENLFV